MQHKADKTAEVVEGEMYIHVSIAMFQILVYTPMCSQFNELTLFYLSEELNMVKKCPTGMC